MTHRYFLTALVIWVAVSDEVPASTTQHPAKINGIQRTIYLFDEMKALFRSSYPRDDEMLQKLDTERVEVVDIMDGIQVFAPPEDVDSSDFEVDGENRATKELPKPESIHAVEHLLTKARDLTLVETVFKEFEPFFKTPGKDDAYTAEEFNAGWLKIYDSVSTLGALMARDLYAAVGRRL